MGNLFLFRVGIGWHTCKDYGKASEDKEVASGTAGADPRETVQLLGAIDFSQYVFQKV